MTNIFKRISNFWSKHGFVTVLIIGVIFIIIFGLIRKIMGKKGSWSSSYILLPTVKRRKGERVKDGMDVNDIKGSKDSKGEIECRRVLEHIFKTSFDKCRPNFLSNPVTGGYNLEIDCYNENLRLGIEYSGRQHYEYVPFFHSSKEAFLNQKYRDELKRRMCSDNNIVLIEVPYTVKVDDIQSYLVKELRSYGFIE